MKIRHFIFLILSILWASPAVHAGESVPVKSGKATAQLVTSHNRALPGDDIQIALSLKLEKHWHTYWRNAGGPGEPAALYWDLPGTLKAGEITWPLPMIVRTGPIVNYAFEDTLLLPMTLHVSKDAKIGDLITINAEAAYLVCYQVCLPESAKLTLPLLIGEPIKDGRWSYKINKVIKEAPKPHDGYLANAKLENGKFAVDFIGDDFSSADYKDPYFFPYEQDLIEADPPQEVIKGEKGVRLIMTAGYGLDGGLKENMQGVIAYKVRHEGKWKQRSAIVTADPNAKIDIGSSSVSTQGLANNNSSIGLWAAVFGAFLGGLILNLMPCVFPVLSLKALGFARIAHDERGIIRKHGLLYALGAILSFLFLAGLLLALKAGGAGLGWGFQLQNPVLVGALSLLFFIIALNLFGYFEIGGKLQNTGADLVSGNGSKSAFFTGVLAVIVATPCTAPFMAGALGFAFAQPAFITLFVFLALGIGFAIPFLILSYSPTLLKRLPKPGVWMDTFKQFLAFPMLATAIWLLWVLTALGKETALLGGLMAMLLVAFAIWLLKRKSMFAKLVAILSLLLGGYCIATLKLGPAQTQSTTQNAAGSWSPEAILDLQAQGHIVFVDFTADWCVTCKVNEKLVLHRKSTKELFAKMGVKTLIADWTRKDADIAAELARHGRSGVPLYLVYGPNSKQPQILPQTLSIKTLKKALEKARKKSK